MSYLDALRGLFRKKSSADDMPYSIVMLVRGPVIMSGAVLNAAASKAYGEPYDGSRDMYFVTWEPLLKVVKVGEYLISVVEGAKPYLGDPAEVARGFKNERLGSAWAEHRTWLAFDLMNRDIPSRPAYKVLAELALQLLDDRFAGIYLSRENQFTIQSDGSAVEHCRRLAS